MECTECISTCVEDADVRNVDVEDVHLPVQMQGARVNAGMQERM